MSPPPPAPHGSGMTSLALTTSAETRFPNKVTHGLWERFQHWEAMFDSTPTATRLLPFLH